MPGVGLRSRQRFQILKRVAERFRVPGDYLVELLPFFRCDPLLGERGGSRRDSGDVVFQLVRHSAVEFSKAVLALVDLG